MASETTSGSTTSWPVDSEEYISRLNDDVLLQIFMLNTEFDFDTPHIPSWTVRHTSQVSTRWRNLSLNSPMIWASSLDLGDGLNWIQTVLDRAGDVPLDIIYPPFSDLILSNQDTLSQWRHLEHEHRMTMVHKTYCEAIDVDRLDIALSLFSRCRRFRLILEDDEEWMHAMNTSITLNSPFLEDFILVVEAPYSYNSQLLPPESSILASIQFKTNLKTLHLSGPGLKPPTFEPETFLNLTTLIMKGLMGLNDKRLTFEVGEWLKMLSFSPQLESLHLVNCFASKPDALNLVIGPPLFLSKLRSLELKGSHVGVCLMFSLINFPPTCAMDLKLWMYDDRYPPLVSQTILLLQQRIQDFMTVQKIDDLSLFLHRRGSGQVAWKFWNNVHSAGENNLCVAWIPDSEADTTPFFLSLKGILEVMSPNLTSLYLDTAKIQQCEPPYRLGLLQNFANVEFLCIPSTSAVKFIRMLFAEPSGHSLLPALQQIMLCHLHITKKVKNRAYRIFETLSRSRASMPKCAIKDCEGAALPGLINLLRGLGVYVEWDEKVAWSESDSDEDSDGSHDPKPDLRHLAIQAKWDGSYKENSDENDASEEYFGSDSKEEDSLEDGEDKEEGSDFKDEDRMEDEEEGSDKDWTDEDEEEQMEDEEDEEEGSDSQEDEQMED